MDEDITPPEPARSRSIRGLVIFAMVCFVIGIAAMGWLLSEWTPARSLVLGASPPPQTVLAPSQSSIPAPAAPEEEIVASPEAHMAKIEEKEAMARRSQRGGGGAALAEAGEGAGDHIRLDRVDLDARLARPRRSHGECVAMEVAERPADPQSRARSPLRQRDGGITRACGDVDHAQHPPLRVGLAGE